MIQPACRTALLAGFALVALARVAPSQQPVEGVTGASTVVQRAQLFLQRGQHDSATSLLNAYLPVHPTDGRAWFFLGRIYLADAQAWHSQGHPSTTSPSLLLDFASTSFEPAQELLTDSGGVFRIVVAVERATVRIEEVGWDSLSTVRQRAEDLPVPPVLAELGKNLLASCPKRGVLVTGSLVEAVSVWGRRLQGDRNDVMLIRPDLYRTDQRYRMRMAAALGVDAAADLGAALAAAARTRPICIAPSVDSIAAPGLEWHASLLVLSTVAPPPPPALTPQLSVFQFARTGLTGSVWTSAARDTYDLAARRNRSLCTGLFASTDALTLPAIPACAK